MAVTGMECLPKISTTMHSKNDWCGVVLQDDDTTIRGVVDLVVENMDRTPLAVGEVKGVTGGESRYQLLAGALAVERLVKRSILGKSLCSIISVT